MNKSYSNYSEVNNSRKAKILISEGYYTKVYSPDNRKSEFYPETEWNSVSGIPKYYKKVPVNVTDEEFKIIEEHYESSDKDSASNPVAKALQIIAYSVYVLGVIMGFVIGNYELSFELINPYYENDFSLLVALVCWIVFFVVGTTFLGFSEVIRLLQDIKTKNNSVL